MKKDDSGFEYRKKEIKRRTVISNVTYKIPISLILKDVNKSQQFYGHIFQQRDLHLNIAPCNTRNTRFVGSDCGNFAKTKVYEEDKKRAVSKRKTLASINKEGNKSTTEKN